ncbi:NAD-dependent epimerase/dehydratase family protein [Synechococcus sp. CCY9201]|uniref:NAD-dependent epimerase/dehydratase family protein n=1 Tax=Synechococcus sp. CCY9201 TaxID=174697 RepID=UPI002B2011B3|nr:NAD-dependent epimerase/dehydratase family protein [Synechococcus sp. CCY9201]MEA5475215.1 NAD-dependent epimerase/dehydratase family protein [Synechococcus sp. CCY9201]
MTIARHSAMNRGCARLLITGGVGFLGTNLIMEISKSYRAGDIVCLDSLESATANLPCLLGKAELIISPICEIGSYSHFIGPETIVIHLAASGGVVDSVKDPISNFKSNVQSTLNILEVMKSKGATKVIFASTGGALMGDSSPPVSEASLPRPISPYGASKLSCEAYLNAYCASYGFKAIMLRFGNVYGMHSAHKKGVINTWLREVTRNKEITIYGDGSETRDFINARDIVQGITQSLCLIEELQCGVSEVFHLANGEGVELGRLADLLFSSMSKKPSIQYAGNRIGEVRHNFADYSKAQKILGFKPVVALGDGIRELVRWSMIHDPFCN